MAKPNYSFEKRQRELAKKKKKEEKRQRKQTLAEEQEGTAPADSSENSGDSTQPSPDND